MSEHAFVQENLAGYVLDGLSAAERERFERHVHGCGECNLLVAEQREFDESLDKMFAGVRPAAGFENRVIAVLRSEPLRRRIAWTKSLRWIGSAAAVLFLAVVGYSMHHLAEGGSLPFPGSWGEERQAQAGVTLGVDLVGGTVTGGHRFAEPFRTFDGDPAARETDTDISYNLGRKAEVSVPGSLGKVKDGPVVIEGRSKDFVEDSKNTVTYVEGLTKERAESLKQLEIPTDRTTATSSATPPMGNSFKKPAVGQWNGADAMDIGKLQEKRQILTIINGDEQKKDTAQLSRELQGLNMPIAPGAVVTTRDGKGAGGGAPMGVGGPGGGFGVPPGMGPATAPKGGFDAGGRSGAVSAKDKSDPSAPYAQPTKATTASTPAYANHGYTTGSLDSSKKATELNYYRTPLAVPGGSPLAEGPKGPSKDSAEEGKSSQPGDSKAGGKGDVKSTEYFKESTISQTERGEKDFLKALNNDQGPVAKSQKEQPAPKGEKQSGKPAAPAAQPVQKQSPVEKPKEAVRKIIRTGDVEFEIESFDNAVGSVTQLINGIQGAFIATVNSEKLPNGKVKGSVIVRMPPEFLDKFLLDLRKELTKTGELKNQRIGSQDVTKQYYDLESRMRAARTMEERLIDIIKKGKGEIKDLLLAEKELGVWRTKLEEMEGEIRYYNNQVGLSTLTITMYEKEIRIAAAMVITEHVNMKIEADDVEKALQSALTAVTEAKGRVTKSDLKQHAAGQYEAILMFEVAPAAAGQVRDKLKTLGVVTHHDAQRLQQAEGGNITTGEIKSRVSDVQFSVSLYNVANIKPREAYILDIATVDVAADYRKLQDAVNLAKGQVRSANLDERDRLNVSAQFEFDVPKSARETFDKMVNGLGDVLSKSTSQAAPGETATDRKVGYRLTLKSLSSVQPRESYKLDLATPDVSGDYRALHDKIAAVKGQVRSTNLNEADKLQTTATLDFDVPVAERAQFDKLLAGLGDTLTRNTIRIPPNQIATERKAGYRLTLRNLATIKPRESYVLQVATPDVAGDYRKLQEAIGEAKGQVKAIQLADQDKLNAFAQLDFDVPAGDRAKFDKMLAGLGETLTRSTIREAPGETATELKSGYRLTLRNLATIQPREATKLDIAAADVSAEYRKLQEAIATAKGQVKAINLNELDKLNTTATIDFDVAVAERSKLDKLLEGLGETLARTTLRVPPGETATELKTGYRLTLRNSAGVKPRETITLQVVSLDVPANYRKLQEEAAKLKAYVRNGQLSEPDKLNVAAQFDFDVPIGEREAIEKLLVEIGEVYTRSTDRVPPSEVATERKVGYRLKLNNATAMTPREKVALGIEVTDVEQTAAALKDMVRAKGGTVVQDPIKHGLNGQVKAELYFNVPLAAKEELLRRFKGMGKLRESTSSSNPQAPDTKLATLHLDVLLFSTAPIVPSDEGMGPQIRRSLTYSFWFLSWSLMLIIFGLMAVLPWALLVWIAVKVVKKVRGKQQPVATAAGM